MTWTALITHRDDVAARLGVKGAEGDVESAERWPHDFPGADDTGWVAPRIAGCADVAAW